MVLSRAPRRLDQTPRHVRIERVAPVGTVHGDREQAAIEFLQDDVVVHEAVLSLSLVVSRHSGMVRQHQISDAQLRIGKSEIPGSMLRIAPE